MVNYLGYSLLAWWYRHYIEDCKLIKPLVPLGTVITSQTWVNRYKQTNTLYISIYTVCGENPRQLVASMSHTYSSSQTSKLNIDRCSYILKTLACVKMHSINFPRVESTLPALFMSSLDNKEKYEERNINLLWNCFPIWLKLLPKLSNWAEVFGLIYLQQIQNKEMTKLESF